MFDEHRRGLLGDGREPAADPLQARRAVLAGRHAPTARTTGPSATLSDIQFTAANPTLAKVGVAAIKRIRKTNPDLIVLNGDITDNGAAEDVALARTDARGGRLRADPARPRRSARTTRRPRPRTRPRATTSRATTSPTAPARQGDLAPFIAEFGQPYGTFDHNGHALHPAGSSLRHAARHRTGRSCRCSRRRSTTPRPTRRSRTSWSSPTTRSTTRPRRTPSQLGDRNEVALVEKMLTDFRDGVRQGRRRWSARTRRSPTSTAIEGVPYTVLPSSGKDPYGTPDRGGFTGWLDWHVDKDATRRRSSG